MNQSQDSNWNSSPFMLPFDEQSTNKLLRQLKEQLKDVEQIIKKSKQSLRIYENERINNLGKLSKQDSEINLQMSLTIAENTTKDQLNYSMSPRVQSNAIQSISLNLFQDNCPEDIMKKLIYEESQQNLLLQSQSYEGSFKPELLNQPDPSSIYQINKADQIKQNNHKNQQVIQQDCPVENEKSIIYSEQQQFQLQYQQIQKKLDKTQNNVNIQIQQIPQTNGVIKDKKDTRVNYFKRNNKNILDQSIQSSIFLQPIDKWNKKSKKSRNVSYEKNEISDSKIIGEIEQNKIAFFNQLKKQNKNMPNVQQFLIQKTYLNGTCTNNQLQNILLKLHNKSNKKTHQKNRKQITNKNFLEESNKNYSNKTYKSIYQEINKIKKLNVTNFNITKSFQKNKKSQLFAKNQKQQKTQQKKSNKSLEKCIQDAIKTGNILSKDNDETHIFQQKQNMIEQSKNKQQFISQMENHCYVRRFLNSFELQAIYNEFRRKKIKKSQWGQKIIEVIFKKINQVQYLL